MPDHAWVQAFPGAVTVCDRDGIILEMNDRSVVTFAEDGGAALIGTNVLDCHVGPTREELTALLAARKTNVYTIEKNGLKKLVYQTPWYQGGEYSGLVELVLELPREIPHHVRAG